MRHTPSGNQPPFSQSYWVAPGKLLAGCYPGAPHDGEMTEKLRNLVALNVSTVVNLMEPDEVDHFGRPFISYDTELKALAAEKGRDMVIIRLPIRDLGIPDKGHMRRILDAIDRSVDQGGVVYLHCWGGRGRTGTVVGCYLIRHGLVDKENVLSMITRLRSKGRNVTGSSPETSDQRAMVLSWEKEGRG